jgi:hypothetical protein
MTDNVVDLNSFKSKKNSGKNKSKKSHKPADNHKELPSLDPYKSHQDTVHLTENMKKMVKSYGLSKDEAFNWTHSLGVLESLVSEAFHRATERNRFNIDFAALAVHSIAAMVAEELFVLEMCPNMSKENMYKLKTSIIGMILNPDYLETTVDAPIPEFDKSEKGENNDE